ncbi:MAG: MFS transporter [Myxococcales bacterium]
MLTWLARLAELDRSQRAAVLASFLGWTLDAFDFFLVVFVLRDISKTFGVRLGGVTLALLATLALRPLGALIFGRLADRYGRRPVLVWNVIFFSLAELLSAGAPTLPAFIAVRALYGVAMGGEWGVGASLAMESIPARARGLVSGLLQQGYAVGYLLAALAYYGLFDLIGWRGLLVLGVAPALLVLYIRRHVAESPAFREAGPERLGLGRLLSENWRLFLSVIALMTGFNLLSHGTQDLYPTFLQVQRHLSAHAVGLIAVVYNFGALLGGLSFGTLSERLGRRRTIAVAALLSLGAVPFWAFGRSVITLALGAFALQFMVQGAWGVVPVHLNELSPPGARGTFPGLAYQLGNLLASANAPLQAALATRAGGDYARVLAAETVVVAIAVAAMALLGREARGREMTAIASAGTDA